MKPSRKKRKLATAKRVAKELEKQKSSKDSYKKLNPEIKSHICNFKITDEICEDILKGKYTADELEFDAEQTYPDHYILMAAIRDDEIGKLYYIDPPSSHGDVTRYFRLYELEKFTDGFVDNNYEFHNRSEAGEIAFKAGQCSEAFRSCLTSTSFKHIRVPRFVYHTSDGDIY